MPSQPVTAKPAAARRVHRTLITVTHLGLIAAVLTFAWRGIDYYLTPLIERAHHPDYTRLKPGGSIGLLFGYTGAGMMTLLLLYSLRKRVKRLRRLGNLTKWLDWHIVMGIYGPLFIVLHSSLKVGGIVSIAFWSMLTVALSGVFGRYLYLQIPRAENGHALSLQEIQQKEVELSAQLIANKAVSGDQLKALNRIQSRQAHTDHSLLLLPWYQFRTSRLIRKEVSRWGQDRETQLRVIRSALVKARLHTRLLLLGRIRRLFHYWHVFHKPFALIMYLLLVVHVAVAWTMGYGRPFG